MINVSYDFSNYGIRRYTSPSTYDGYVLIPATSFIGLLVENTAFTIRYLQIFDNNVPPSNGDSPIISIKLPIGGQDSCDASSVRFQALQKGLVVATSTTGPYYTNPNASDQFLTVWYK